MATVATASQGLWLASFSASVPSLNNQRKNTADEESSSILHENGIQGKRKCYYQRWKHGGKKWKKAGKTSSHKISQHAINPATVNASHRLRRVNVVIDSYGSAVQEEENVTEQAGLLLLCIHNMLSVTFLHVPFSYITAAWEASRLLCQQ